MGLYREYEWIDRIVQMKILRTNNTSDKKITFASMEHFNISHRTKITKALRLAVWDCKQTEQDCICCKDIISITDFHCGHIVSVARGGATVKNNLKPICATCNSDMGVMNLYEYCALINEQL